MACCGLNTPNESGATGQLIMPLPFAEFDAFRKRASNAPQFKGHVIDDYRIGAVQMPNGQAIYAATVTTILTSAKAKGGWKSAFYTELGGYQVVLDLEVDESIGEFSFHAGLVKDNAGVIDGRWKVRSTAQNSINAGGLLGPLDIDILDQNQLAESKGCFENCIKRHAPKCVYICLNYGKEACIACAGAVVACCYVNCHC